MRGIAKAEREKIAHDYLALAKLTEAAERYPNELSGGMQQRVGVVRALANEPDVLLMDEPFASVDAQTRMTLQEELTRIWQDKKPTVIFITHDVAEAVFLANRVVALSKGRVLRGDRGRPAAAAVVGRAARGRAVQGADRPRAAARALGVSHVARRAHLAQDPRAARASRRPSSAWQLWLTRRGAGQDRRLSKRRRTRQHTGDAAVPAGAVSCPAIPDVRTGVWNTRQRRRSSGSETSGPWRSRPPLLGEARRAAATRRMRMRRFLTRWARCCCCRRSRRRKRP